MSSDLRAAMEILDKEWPEFISGLPIQPEDSKAVPWPVRNFVRRARAALAASAEPVGEPRYDPFDMTLANGCIELMRFAVESARRPIAHLDDGVNTPVYEAASRPPVAGPDAGKGE